MRQKLSTLIFVFSLLSTSVPCFARDSSKNQKSFDDEQVQPETDPAKVMQLMMQQMQAMDKASDKLFEEFFGESPTTGPSFDDFDKIQQQFLNRLNQQTTANTNTQNGSVTGQVPSPQPLPENAKDEASAYGAQVTQQESHDKVTLRVDVPGLDESSLNIRIENGFLHLTGNTQKEKPTQNDPSALMMQESTSVHFEKILPLPEDADASKMDVKKNGDSVELIFAKLAPGK